MKRPRRITTLILMGLMGFSLMIWASHNGHQYVGVESCKVCHRNAKKGAQHQTWEASKHAGSFEVLKSEHAIEQAKDKGIGTAPHEAPECLKCHTTGFGHGGYEIRDEVFWNPGDKDKAGKKAVNRMAGLQNVSCEACHGAGSHYKNNKTMNGIAQGLIDPAKVGLIRPTNEVCVRCHGDEFNYEERVQIIAHLDPRKKR